jgi:phosphoribulokinase
VPTIDTSNPFAAEEIPTSDQSFTLIHVRNTRKVHVDFLLLLEMLNGSFMSAPDTIVVPSGKMTFAMQLLVNPVIRQLMERRNAA